MACILKKKSPKKLEADSLFNADFFWTDIFSFDKIDEKIINQENEFFNFIISTIIIYLYRIDNYQPVDITISLLDWDFSVSYAESKKIILTPHFSLYKAFHKIKNNFSIFLKTNVQHKKHLFPSKRIQIEWSSQVFDGRAEDLKKLYFVFCCRRKEILIAVNKEVYVSWRGYISKHLKNIFYELLKDSSKKINNFSFMARNEIQSFDVWNDNSYKINVKDSISDIFERNAKKTPNKIAFINGSKKITYASLSRMTTNFSSCLLEKGFKKGEFATIFLERSLEVLVAMLGVLRVGGAYVPVDLNYPAERVKYIFENSKSSIFVTKTNLVNQFLKKIKPVILNSLIEIDLEKHQANKLNLLARMVYSRNNKNVAYVLYTSGTTGLPKGVLVTHGNIINYAAWFLENFHLKENSVIDFSSSIAFDITVSCTLVPLMAGSKIVLCPEKIKHDPVQYLQFLERNRITHVETVPDYFSHMLRHRSLVTQLKYLKWILLGGDAVVKKDIETWLSLNKKQKIVNEYGPTECTVSITAHIVNNRNIHEYGDFIPIGRPAFNTQAYILDKHKNISPIGIPGELYIAGASVASGYISRQETRKKFIRYHVDDRKFTIYKTGDLTSWTRDGNILFLGRIDDQVKIRGFRIEILEIENCLLKNKFVKQCKILVKVNKDGEKYLAAYIVLERQKANLDQSLFRKFLSSFLPSYMIPTEFIFVDCFPTHPNGKVDAKLLLNISINQNKKRTHFDFSNIYEEKLAAIWEKIFDFYPDSAADDFFELGGNSLLAIKIINYIEEEIGVRLPTATILKNTTFSKLAKAMEIFKNNSQHTKKLNDIKKEPDIICMQPSGDKNPLFLVHPVGGTVFFYKPLVAYLNKDRPIYALQDPGIDNPSINFDSLEEMAACYVHAIKKIQTAGPFFLAGASFGATLVIEMVNQLNALGEDVSFVGLFDGWANYPESLRDKDFFKKTMRQIINEKDISGLDFILDRQYSRERLLFDYKIPRLANKIILFKSTILWPIFQLIDSPFNNWEIYLEKPPILYNVFGDHESIFFDPHVENLARVVFKSINR